MPDSLLLGIRLMLAVMFAVAGAAKLQDRSGSREALRGFGVPDRMSPAASVLLPVVELALAVGLVLPRSARLASALASVLLLVFAGAVVSAMAQGRKPDCHCFGQLQSAPAGGRTLARNLALSAVAAVIALTGPGPSVGSWLDSLSGAQLRWTLGALAGLLVIAQAVAIFSLLRRYGRVLLRAEELELGRPRVPLALGEPALEFALPDRDGSPLTLGGLLRIGNPVLLVFSDRACGPCQALVPELIEWNARLSQRLTIAMLSQPRERQGLVANDDGLRFVADDEDGEVRSLYGLAGTPAAILIEPQGTVAAAPAYGRDAISGLLASVVPDPPASHEPVLAPAGRPKQPPALGRVGPSPAAVRVAAVGAATASLAGADLARANADGAVTAIAEELVRCAYDSAKLLAAAQADLRKEKAWPPTHVIAKLHQQLERFNQAIQKISRIHPRNDIVRHLALEHLSAMWLNTRDLQTVLEGKSASRVRAAEKMAQQRIHETDRSARKLDAELRNYVL